MPVVIFFHSSYSNSIGYALGTSTVGRASGYLRCLQSIYRFTYLFLDSAIIVSCLPEYQYEILLCFSLDCSHQMYQYVYTECFSHNNSAVHTSEHGTLTRIHWSVCDFDYSFVFAFFAKYSEKTIAKTNKNQNRKHSNNLQTLVSIVFMDIRS